MLEGYGKNRIKMLADILRRMILEIFPVFLARIKVIKT